MSTEDKNIILVIVGSLGILFGLFYWGRMFILWYFKIDIHIKQQAETNALLREQNERNKLYDQILKNALKTEQ